MADARIEHVFNCNEETYWGKLFFDEEYNRRLFLDTLGFESWRVATFEETDTEARRVVEATPKMGDIPGPIKKLLGAGLGYTERDVLDKKKRRMRIDVTPRSLSDKVTVRGELFTEGAGEGKCRRIYTTSVVAKIFGVGGLIESRLLADMRASYDRAAVFTNKFIAEKGLGAS